MHLFTEIFPIDTPPTLTAYKMRLYDLPPDYPPVDLTRLGRALVARLRKRLPDGWLWQDGRVLTDSDALTFDLTAIVDQICIESPQPFEVIQTLEPDYEWQPQPLIIAEFVIKTKLTALDEPLNAALAKTARELAGTQLRVEREYKAAAWNAGGLPAVSLSISARVVCDEDAQAFITRKGDPNVLVGLRVADKTSTLVGEVVKITGTVGERREKLLQAAAKGKGALTRLIEAAPDSDAAVRVSAGDHKHEFPAVALQPLIRPADFTLFGIDERAADPALRPDPPTRAMLIKALSDITKERGVLGKAFSSREHPQLFANPEFEPYLRFAKNRSRPHIAAKLSMDFTQCGAYHLRDSFRQAPVKVGVVNALPMKVEDFVEALQRQLTRSFDFKIEVIRERKVRVVSLENVESAVRVVEKEQPDIILAFVPDESEVDDLPAYVKSLLLGRGIPAQVLFQSVLDDPDSMPGTIMAILAKTGNTPFALADPLDYADFVVGLHLVRQEGEPAQVTAIARIYRASGEFVRYAVRRVELSGGALPFVLMRDLFPQRDFAGKRVVIHHDGRLEDDTRQALAMWGQAIKAVFCPVEIVRKGAPRLFGFAENRVQAPPWGSYFKLNEREGFVILNLDDEDSTRQTEDRRNSRAARPHSPTPQPLHIVATGITLDQAVRSLQLWTLLYYGTSDTTRARIPVTIYGAGELAYWLRKGGTINLPEGEVPFWL